jgi:hypothetical protein
MDIVCHGLLVVAAIGFRARSEAAQIGRDHQMRFGEFGDQWPPHMAGLRITIQKNDGISFGKAVLNCSRHLCRRGTRQRHAGEKPGNAGGKCLFNDVHSVLSLEMPCPLSM